MKKAYITLCNSEKYIRGTLVLYESLNLTKTNIPLLIFLPKKTPEKVRLIFKNYAKTCENNNCKMVVFESEQDIVLPSACFDGQYDRKNLNSGLMVIEPTSDIDEMNRITSFISQVVTNPQFGDQDIIRLAFPDWSIKTELHLSEQYNLFFENAALKKKEMNYDIEDNADMPVYIIHFIGWDKPWFRGKKLKWKVYNLTWKTKMCISTKKKFNNNITERIFRFYDFFFMIVNRKLKEAKVKIYEMV